MSPSELIRRPWRKPVAALAASWGLSAAAQAAPSPARTFDSVVQPFLAKHCLHCHDAKKQKGDFRLDTLSREVGLKDTP